MLSHWQRRQTCKFATSPELTLGALVGLYQHLHASDAPLPSRAEVERVWDELVGNARYRHFGVFAQEKLVCSCNLAVVPNLTRGCRPYGVIENVVTHAEHRRRGYGQAVLGAALNEAWRQGCYKVMLQTGRKDEDTFRCYESAGFSRSAKQAFVARAPV